MQKCGPITRAIFILYSRTFFRTCEIVTNHISRVFFTPKALATQEVSATLGKLNSERIKLQGHLNIIGNKHAQVCADCKGECCGGRRERDAYMDRVIQRPDTEHVSARRKSGRQVAYDVVESSKNGYKVLDAATPPECAHGYCPELTVEGCKLPYELRPIQCTAYFCMPTIRELPQREAKLGIASLGRIMRLQMRTAGLAIKSRFSG